MSNVLQKDEDVVEWDPGHGGHQPGAVHGGIEEEDVVLDIAKRCASKLEKQFIAKSRLTRDKDEYVNIHKRDDIAAKHNAKLFVSLHLNAFTNDKAHGGESYRHPLADDRTRKIHVMIHAEFSKGLDKYGIHDRGTKLANFAVLRENNRRGIPAVLIEILFLSNPRERALLKNEKFLEDISQAIVNGVARAMGFARRPEPQIISGVKYQLICGTFENEKYAHAALTKARAGEYKDAYLKTIKE